jgi:hypothetical protein
VSARPGGRAPFCLAVAVDAQVGDPSGGVDGAHEAHVALLGVGPITVAVGVAIGRLGIGVEAAVDQAGDSQGVAVAAFNGGDGGNPRLAGIGP